MMEFIYGIKKHHSVLSQSSHQKPGGRGRLSLFPASLPPPSVVSIDPPPRLIPRSLARWLAGWRTRNLLAGVKGGAVAFVKALG